MSQALEQLQAAVIAFRNQRDWAQFHTPRHLTAALAIEAAELQEQLLWLTDEQAKQHLLDPAKREGFEDEMADVFAYLLCLAELTDTDLATALIKKIQKNETKYPAKEAKGRSDKYTQYINDRKSNYNSQ